MKVRTEMVLDLRQRERERQTDTQREEDAENQAESPECGDTSL